MADRPAKRKMADWAGLHDNLLYEIGKRLISIESYESFGAVCKSWRAATIKDKDHLKQKTFESRWHILPDKESNTREFFNSSTGKTHKIFLPEAKGRYCLLCQDWLLVVAKDIRQTSFLLHLVSRTQIPLPFPQIFFPVARKYGSRPHRFLLLANPNSTNDYIVVVIWHGVYQLGFWKPGDTYWTSTEDWEAGLSNITYHNNKLYALDLSGCVVRCDIHGSEPTKLRILYCLRDWFGSRVAIAEFSKKILIILIRSSRKTGRFNVYEVDIENGKWMEIKDLGNKALFVCNYLSFECSEINNFKPNCIYFTDVHVDDDTSPYLVLGCKNMSMYHLRDGIKPLVVDEEIVYGEIAEQTRSQFNYY